MLKSLGGLTFQSFMFFPIAILLWPLVVINYKDRRNGDSPDQWYWADRLLIENGWYVDCANA